jgi:hypothetical protein
MKAAKKANVTPLTPPAKSVPALPPVLVAGMFAEAGVLLRPGRADTIAATLGAAVARFRSQAAKLPFECEPSLFPLPLQGKEKRR